MIPVALVGAVLSAAFLPGALPSTASLPSAHPSAASDPVTTSPAQLPVSPPGGQDPPVLHGRLLYSDAPADSGTVVLHRVTPEEAGPVDSVRVDPDGGFRMVLPGAPTPGSGEVYFATARRDGIVYYGEPLAASEQLAETYVIRSWPTRPAPAGGLDLPVSVRNLFIEAGPIGWRITDLIEVRNDSAVTFLTGDETGPLWRYPLSSAARAVRTGEGEVDPGSVGFRDGHLELRGPLLPGERLIVVRYDVEEVEFSLPLPGRNEVVEVLVREPVSPLRMEGLTSLGTVELEEGSRYRRWAGEGLVDRVVRVREGEERPPQPVPGWVAVGLALLFALAGIWVILRYGSGPPTVGEAPRGPPG